MQFDDPTQLPGSQRLMIQEPVRFIVVSGPEDPRYFELRNFPKARPGQSWIDARKEQVAAIDARAAEQRRLARLHETIPYQIIASRKEPWPAGAIKGRTKSAERSLRDVHGLRQGNDRRLIDDFAKLIPHRPYCADVVSDGLQIRNSNSR